MLRFLLFPIIAVVVAIQQTLVFADSSESPSDGSLQCPAQLMNRDERGRLILEHAKRPRDPDCDAQTDIHASPKDKAGRIWYVGRESWIACPTEIDGAETILAQALSNIFSTTEGKGWLNDIFSCDPKLLVHLLGVGRTTAERLTEQCRAHEMTYPCKDSKSPIHLRVAKALENHPYPRKLLLQLGATPADCIDSYTFPTGATVLGFPDGKVTVERTEMLLLHEIAVLLDGKSSLGGISANQISGKEPLQALRAALFSKMRTSFAALRALGVEKRILMSTGRWSQYKDQSEFKAIEGIEESDEKCMKALRDVSKTMARTRLNQMDDFEDSARMTMFRDASLVVTPDVMIGLSAPGLAVLERNQQAIQGHTISAKGRVMSLCSFLATPQLDGLNIWSVAGPRPRIGGGD